MCFPGTRARFGEPLFVMQAWPHDGPWMLFDQSLGDADSALAAVYDLRIGSEENGLRGEWWAVLDSNQ